MFHIYRELLLFTLNFVSLMTNFIWFLHQTMEIFTIQVKILNSFQYCFHFLVDTLLHSTYLQFYIECAITVWYILYHRLEQCSEFKVMCMCAELLHCVWLFVTQYTVARHSPPGSSVHGILQARILGWAAMPSNRRSSRPRDCIRISYVSCISRRVLYH